MNKSALAETSAERQAEVFAVLADPVRLRLLSLIASSPGRTCPCDVVDLVNRCQPTVSHYLKVLHGAGLLGQERCGRWIWYEALSEAASLLDCC